jgi:hypothetical protein
LGLLKEEADVKLSPGLRNIKDVLQRLRTFCTVGSPGSLSVYSYCKLIGDNMVPPPPFGRALLGLIVRGARTHQIIDRFFNILKRFTRMESNRFNPWRLRQIDHNGSLPTRRRRAYRPIVAQLSVFFCRCPGAAPSVPLRLHDLPSRLSSAAPGRLRLAPGGRTPHLRQELSIYPAAASTRTTVQYLDS